MGTYGRLDMDSQAKSSNAKHLKLKGRGMYCGLSWCCAYSPFLLGTFGSIGHMQSGEKQQSVRLRAEGELCLRGVAVRGYEKKDRRDLPRISRITRIMSCTMVLSREGEIAPAVQVAKAGGERIVCVVRNVVVLELCLEEFLRS